MSTLDKVIKLNRKQKIAIAIIAGVSIATLLYLFNPEQTELAPQCWFYRLTGWKCPGCGTQRAIHQLLHGRLGEAFGYNPFLFFAIPYLAIMSFLQYCNGRERFPKIYRILWSQKGIMTVFFVIVFYWIGRNLIGI